MAPIQMRGSPGCPRLVPIQSLLIIATIFIVINYGLGKLAEYVERRMGRASGSSAGDGAEAVPAGWDAGFVEVADTLEALQNLGRHVARGFDSWTRCRNECTFG